MSHEVARLASQKRHRLMRTPPVWPRHVVRPTCVERPSRRWMSPCTNAMKRLHKGLCRTLHLCGATYEREHVAPDPRQVRHVLHCMSHHETVKGDMRSLVYRSMHVCGATSIDHDVASPRGQERHGRQSMSLHPVVRSDMSSRACRPTWSAGATWGHRVRVLQSARQGLLDRQDRREHLLGQRQFPQRRPPLLAGRPQAEPGAGRCAGVDRSAEEGDPAQLALAWLLADLSPLQEASPLV